MEQQQDLIGLDRLARSLLRVVARTEPGGVIALHGGPGSGKAEFFRRLAWMAHSARQRGESFPGLYGTVVWFDPWVWTRQGNLLAGLVAAVVRAAPRSPMLSERARQFISDVGRIRLDGRPLETPGAAFTGASVDPVEAMADVFVELIKLFKNERPGRVLFFVDNVDRLSPELRWHLFDGLQLILRGQPDCTALLCVGKEAALAGIRWHEGALTDAQAQRVMEGLFDLSITVPTLDVRRIGALLRSYLGPSEETIARSFGAESILTLSAAVAHRPLGSPRFLRRLSLRVTLLAEYAAEIRSARVLSEAQWAWIILSERWPRFRSFMVSGGRVRWDELRAWLASPEDEDRAGALGEWLAEDRFLADYLRLHARGILEDGEGIFWLEGMLLASGL